MKKLTLFSIIVCLAQLGTAQETNFDFSAPTESGQVLYYNILDSVAHTVELTCPGQSIDYQCGWDGYQQPSGQLILPSMVNHDGQEYTVVAVGDYAFYRCTDIREEVSVPSTVKRLGKHSLQIEIYPESANLILSEGLVVVDENACSGYYQISQLPNSIEKIGYAAFADNNIRGHLVLPQSLRVLGKAAFSDCYFLKEVTIPENVDSIGSNAFYFNTQLQKVNFNARNCSYIASSIFENCGGISQLVIGEQVQSIIPQLNIYPISTVTVKAQIPPVISENTFANLHNKVFYVPKGSWERYHNAQYWSSLPNKYELPGSFAPEGAEWYFTKLSTGSILNDFHHMEVMGKDTITVNGDAVEVSVISSPLHSEEPQYVYEKDKVVYWYNPVKEAFTTLYDFNAKVGDSWIVSIDSTDYEVLVIALQNHIYNHCSYQIQWVRSIGSGLRFDGKIMEGIGYEHGLFPIAMSQASSDSTYIHGIRCYMENDTILYHNGYFDCDQVAGWNGFEWYYEIQNNDGTITYQHLEYAADTTIGTQRPKIIVRSNTHYDRDEVTNVTHEYVFEEDGKVYWWNKQLQRFTMLYDYSAETGDEWEITVGTERLSMHVDSVENIEFDDKTYRLLHVSDENDLFGGDILCGIGHMTSYFPERLMNRGKNYSVEGLRCYWIDSNLSLKVGERDCDAIYSEIHGVEEDGPSTGLGTFTVYPNPTNGVLFVRTHAVRPYDEYRITNLMGQTLLQGSITTENQQIDINRLPAGMYFINVGEQTLKFVKQ